MSNRLPLSALILAGGKGLRMGRNKALLPFKGQPIVSYLHHALSLICDEVFVSVKDKKGYEFLDVSTVEDQYRDVGPLAGIFSGLQAAHNDWLFVLACDMPFFSKELIRLQWEIASKKAQVICPESERGLEPLHALYRKSAVPAIQEAIFQGQYKVSGFFPKVNVVRIPWSKVCLHDPAGTCFQNWNHPKDMVSLQG